MIRAQSENPLRVRLLVALLGAFALSSAPVAAQRPDLDLALAGFSRAARAMDDLTRIEVTPGDANGQLRRWDRNWRPALHGLQARWPTGRYSDCAGVVATALWDATLDVENARSDLPVAPGATDLGGLVATFAAHRLLAEEAVRRTRSDQICEDLPVGVILGEDGEAVSRLMDVALRGGDAAPDIRARALVESGIGGLNAYDLRAVPVRDVLTADREVLDEVGWRVLACVPGAGMTVDIELSISGPTGYVQERDASPSAVTASDAAEAAQCVDLVLQQLRFPRGPAPGRRLRYRFEAPGATASGGCIASDDPDDAARRANTIAVEGEAQRRVRKMQTQLATCVGDEVGLALVAIEVRGDGIPTRIEIGGSPFGGTAAARCMERILQGVCFPGSREASYSVRVPVSFREPDRRTPEGGH